MNIMKCGLKKIICHLPIVLFVLSIAAPIFINAQENNLRLERIYKYKEFDKAGFGPAKWLEDGSGYTTLEKSQIFIDAYDIIKYNPTTGERHILVDASKLISNGNKIPLQIYNYFWSRNGNKLLIFTNTVRVLEIQYKG